MASHFSRTLLFLTLFIAQNFAQSNYSNPIVDLGYAKYRGHYNDTLDINQYLGLPFAKSPVGALRWKAPEPYSAPANVTNTIIDATQPGATCVQGFPVWTGEDPVLPPGSEDCLVLDIYQPGTTEEKARLPVLFSIHGGGYTTGSANIPLLSPFAMMRHSNNAFIFVNIQYRLGAYGFLGSDKYSQDGGATNVGLMDQRLAMDWVQKNIERFGGDPDQVTILGGSAGGGSVTSHLIWKGGAEEAPFRAAIADFPWWQQLLRKEQLSKQYGSLLSASNCTTLACLQALPEDTLKAATQATYIQAYADGDYGYGNFYYGPYVDGDIIQDLPTKEFEAGHFTKVPTWVSREGLEGFSFSNQSMETIEEENADLRIQFPYANQSFFTKLYELYPREEFNSTLWQRLTWFGDFSINCPTYYIVSNLAKFNVPVYKELFNAGTKLHGSTAPYLADLNYASEPGANVTLANAMKDWYISFAIHADPNFESWSETGKPYWPDYETGEVMSINDTDTGAVSDVYYDDSARCQFFWDNNEVVQN